ncbi:hypothetical protein BAT_1988 [Bacillus pumilus ATCC 7061]|nr:hypothetical protein BAT_1988 [Bacillus pumilus ATCC 7061]
MTGAHFYENILLYNPILYQKEPNPLEGSSSFFMRSFFC